MEKPYHILIVDDGLLNLRILTDALEDTYRVTTVTTGGEVLRAARKHRPHLILLDIILPDINGFEVLKALKKNVYTSSIPVMFD